MGCGTHGGLCVVCLLATALWLNWSANSVPAGTGGTENMSTVFMCVVHAPALYNIVNTKYHHCKAFVGTHKVGGETVQQLQMPSRPFRTHKSAQYHRCVLKISEGHISRARAGFCWCRVRCERKCRNSMKTGACSVFRPHNCDICWLRIITRAECGSVSTVL